MGVDRNEEEQYDDEHGIVTETEALEEFEEFLDTKYGLKIAGVEASTADALKLVYPAIYAERLEAYLDSLRGSGIVIVEEGQ